MTNIAEEIKKKIEDQKIKPKPKAWFVLRQVLLLTGAIVSLIFISLALSLILEILEHQELWALKGKIFLLLQGIPYFWIGIAVIIGVLGYLDLRKTKYGYKIRLWKIMAGMLVGCVVLTSAFYFMGVSERAEDGLEKRVGGYHKVVPVPRHHWMQPEQGLLMGEIMDFSEEEIELQDMEKNDWIIIIDQQTRMDPHEELRIGRWIKILGEAEEGFTFKAFEIFLNHKPY